MRDAIRSYVSRARSRARVPTVSPEMATLWVLILLYAAMSTAALAIAVGATLFVWSHVGVHAAMVVGGTITFAVSYVGVRVVDALRGGGRE